MLALRFPFKGLENQCSEHLDARRWFPQAASKLHLIPVGRGENLLQSEDVVGGWDVPYKPKEAPYFLCTVAYAKRNQIK